MSRLLLALLPSSPHQSSWEREWGGPKLLRARRFSWLWTCCFLPPKGLEGRVAFWLDVYTKYNSNKGVLHDRDLLDVIYQRVDVSAIEQDKTLSDRGRAKARDKMMDVRRQVIQERLVKLSSLTSAQGLVGKDLRYWKMFEKYGNPEKFKEAADEKRIRFQLGQSDRFQKGIYQSGRY